MIKEYYEIKTYMHFEKTVLVPVDEVEDEYEANELVSKAVEVIEIDLLVVMLIVEKFVKEQ